MSIDPNMMPMDDMGSDLDMMAMQEAMGGGGMEPGMDEMTTVTVPVWAVPAVEELVAVLEAEIASGNVDPAMLAMGGAEEPAAPF
ncbi:MAG: hypothetical protein ACO395_07840 [Pontimonas sp.]